ncbi:MAG: hypothetical protein GXO76_15030, partial [Calditrichaeota bacterium]|nr:hypothetical protein [Calditrichota bacterium]
NAFDILIRNYNKIIALFPDQELATDNDNWYTTYSTYDVHVENDTLFPPNRAELKMNVYFTEPLSVEDYFEKITAVLDNRVTFSRISGSERVYLNPKTPVFLEMQHLLEKYFQQPILPKAENGSSDARFFTGRGFPILIVKVVGEGHHTLEEYLHIPSIVPLYRALEEFVEIHGRINSDVLNYVNQKEEAFREIHS